MADEKQLAPPTARVEEFTITASWQFAAADAPTTFTVTIMQRLDATREKPVVTAKPISIERRATGEVVEWTATITLTESTDERAFRVRPTAGDPLDVGDLLRAPSRVPPPNDAVEHLIDLHNLIEQQPDGGRAILTRMMPSADPDELRAAIEQEIDRAVDPDTRAIWPLDGLFKPKIDEQTLNQFVAAYKLADISKDDAKSQRYQTKEDWARYASAPGAAWFHGGGQVDPPLSDELEDPVVQMSYKLRDDEMADGSISVALFADYGNGTYAPRAIAKQIVNAKLPYAFHLGDVYYGGSEQEFGDHFEAPLTKMLDDTELFMITGNHEMYARGEWFNRFVRRKAIEHPARQRQGAESFRLCGDKFQIIGLDTMFVGWSSGRPRVSDYADDDRIYLLKSWLDERPNDLTILLTSNEAWDRGSRHTSRLYESLRATIAGRVDLWFWGNVHYASLYDMWPFADTGNPLRRMVTSCIGHGGYPFYTQKSLGVLPEGLACRWYETKSRFWPAQNLRGDLGLNGWCRMNLTREADGWAIGLTYIDWVGRERVRARLGRKDAGGIYFKSVEESEIASVGAQPTWHPRPLGSVT